MRVKTFDMRKGNRQTATADFSVTAGVLGTSVSSAAWSVEGSVITLGTPVLASNVAQVPLISGSSKGCAVVECEATMADGSIISEFLKINVLDPVCL